MPLFVTGYVIIITSDAQESFRIGIAVISLVSNFGILYLVTYMVENTKVLLENENLRQEQEYYLELEIDPFFHVDLDMEDVDACSFFANALDKQKRRETS